MKQSIGQIIKRLRKERGYTQEELAQMLNISAQSVSKWENEASMPDISQVVPIASVFGVTTDTLFGVQGISDEEAVDEIFRKVEAVRTEPPDEENVILRYKILREGLEQYPNNIRLLGNCLEFGLTIAYPYNKMYHFENRGDVYRECVRMADLILTYGKNTTDILRAHMIMVLLHSAYGDEEKAREHAEQFPWRADMIKPKMEAYIARHRKNYELEGVYCEDQVLQHFEALLDSIAERGYTYQLQNQHEEALECYFRALKLIDLFFSDEPARPPVHYRERGDLYALIAQVYLGSGRKEEALDFVEKMVNYDMENAASPEFRKYKNLHSPLTKHINNPFYYYVYDIDYVKRLQEKLNAPGFDCLRDDPRFRELAGRIK